MRWYVQRSKNELDSEDVGADSLTIEHGTLIFRTAGQIEYAVAPGAWFTVTPEEVAGGE